MGKAIILEIGSIFGDWEIIGGPEKHPTKAGTHQLCKCTICDFSKLQHTYELKSGRISNCPYCFKRKRSRILEIGEEINSWVVQSKPISKGAKGKSRTYYLCKCVKCGTEKEIRFGHLIDGSSRSCRSCAMFIHGEPDTPTHISWRGMIERCTNLNHKEYNLYGGRGIKVCEKWTGENGYINFKHDMGERPINMTIDRINTNGNYEPDNCKWSTDIEQQRNTSRNSYYEYNGENLCIAEWAERLNMKQSTLGSYLRCGHTIEEALIFYNITL